MRKKNETEGITLSDLKPYYKATVIKAVCTSIRQWRRIEKSNKQTRKKHPAFVVNLSTTKEEKIYNGQNSLFNNWCWENRTATCKIVGGEHSLTPYIIKNLKRLKDLNIRPETMKLIEENIGRTLFDINYSNIFLDQSAKAKEWS